MKKLIQMFIFLFSCLAASGSLAAQTTGSISGVVADKKDSVPLYRAIVNIEETNTKVTADHQGNFSISNITPGEYTVSVICAGYDSKKIEKVAVISGEQTKINFYLRMQATMPALAQSTGNISDVVAAEKDSIPLADAIVKIEGTSLSTVTDRKGTYLITNVFPGTYNLITTCIGYEKKIIQRVKVRADKEILFYILLSRPGIIW